MAAVYKVGKKWRADFTDKDGVRHRDRFNTKAEAHRYLVEKQSEIKAGTYVAPKDIPTFGALADSWIAGRIGQSKTPGHGYRPSTLCQWQSHVEHMKAVLGETTKSNDIDAKAIERAIGELRLSRNRGGRGLSVKTTSKVLTTMSRVFRFGISGKYGIHVDPVKLVEKIKEDSGEQTPAGVRLKILREVTEREVLTPEEVKRVILAAKPGLYRMIIMAAIYTGARISELLALRWQDVKLDSGVVEIRRSLSTARVKGEINSERIRWFDPKSERGTRDIPISPNLVLALREWKEKCLKGDLVFSNGFGGPCERTGIGRHGLKPALKQAGIDKAVSMHGLRHTYASMLILLKRPITEVSRYLGHADVNITLRVYAHFLEQKKPDTMSDLERLIENG
jgi:integrase